MLTKSEVLRKIFQYITIVFVIVFFGFIFSGNFIYALSGQFVENYLSIYSNAHDLLRHNQLPMWSWNFFLGGNFLGAQNLYSIYNPFFLVTLLFSSNTLPYLYFPLLFLKTCCAVFALYLYMKETKWFSLHTIIIASLIYIFNGWYLTNLNEFITIDLLLFVPLVLYGVEKMLNSGKKRYFVATFSLILISHFTFTLLFLPFLVVYLVVRMGASYEQQKEMLKRNIKNILLSVLIVLGINMVFILPLIFASNTMHLQIQQGMTWPSLLSLAIKGLFPPLHENYAGTVSSMSENISKVSLYQSILVILLIPQFLKLINKRIRLLTIVSYIGLLAIVFMTQSIQIVNITSLATLNVNVLAIILMLFNALMVAYVLNDAHNLDLKLLKQTSYAYKGLLFLVLALVLGYEIVSAEAGDRFTFESIYHHLIEMTPYFMLFLLMTLIISAYRFILGEMSKDNTELRGKVIFIVVMLEVIFVAYNYFETNSRNSYSVVDYISDHDYIGNETYAVADYIQVIDPEFYRIINSYETQYNEPLYRRYNGFSIGNNRLQLGEGISWMLDKNVRTGLSISTSDYMLTTALSAKYYFTPDYEVPVPGYEYFDRIGSITIYKNSYFIPVGSSVAYYVLESEFEALTQAQKSYVFLNCVILADEEASQLATNLRLQRYDLSTLPNELGEMQYYQAAKLRQGRGVENVTYTQNRVHHDFVAATPTLLVYSIPFDEGWNAYSDGKILNVHNVNGGFIGVEIPDGGEYAITLEYKAPGFEIGFSISSITVLIIIGCFFKYRDDKKKESLLKS